MSSPNPASVELDEARTLLRTNAAILVDVREQHEWDAGHAAEAVHMPLRELDAAALPPDTEIIITCRSGSRGTRATAALIEAGRSARNLIGGMRRWQSAGHPLESTDGTPGSVV